MYVFWEYLRDPIQNHESKKTWKLYKKVTFDYYIFFYQVWKL